jgi:hypothetical protein
LRLGESGIGRAARGRILWSTSRNRKAPAMNEDQGAGSPILGIVFTLIALAILLVA